MSEPHSKFCVAICGGGIGGLTLAYALSKSPDIHVDVYEAASKFTEIGAGIGVWWRTRQILRSLGLEEDLLCLLDFRPGQDRVPFVQNRKADQPDGLDMGSMYTRGGMMGLHRAEFHERLENYVQQPGVPIVLHFQDGTTATCDILIGADGVKSAVRKTMFKEAATCAESQHRNSEASEPRFSGFFSCRALIPAERLSSISPQHRALSTAMRYLGENRHIVTYPISRGRFINFAALEFHSDKEGTRFDGPWVTDVDPSYIQGLFHGWEKEADELVQCLGDLKISRWAVNVLPTLPFFSFGNVAILGDAAHAMTPFLGIGAGQAIEDASILASLLSNKLTTKATVPQVLEIYSLVCQPFSTEVSRRSRLTGELLMLRSLAETGHHDNSSSARLQGIMKQIQENFDWVSETDASVNMEQAMNLINKRLTLL